MHREYATSNSDRLRFGVAIRIAEATIIRDPVLSSVRHDRRVRFSKLDAVEAEAQLRDL